MGFYIRKSFGFGPLRLNLSTSGVGLSFGVKGLRVGTGPRGPYVHAGRGGIYYRKQLGKGSAGVPDAPPRDDLAETIESCAEGRTAEEIVSRFDAAASGVPPSDLAAMRTFLYQTVVWKRVLDDRQLTAEEEALVGDLERRLGIHPQEVEREQRALADYERLRDATKEAMPVVTCSLKLKAGEVVHHQTPGSVVEKRRNDWAAVQSGDIYITSERVLVVGDGTTSIGYEGLLDVDVDPHVSHITLSIDGRRKPYVLEVPDAVYAGAMIERARTAAPAA